VVADHRHGLAKQPVFTCICPQHAWDAGTTTSCPRRSSREQRRHRRRFEQCPQPVHPLSPIPQRVY
jgi:hypothetical protein